MQETGFPFVPICSDIKLQKSRGQSISIVWNSMLPWRCHPNKAGIKVRTQDDCTSMPLSINHKHKQKCNRLPQIWEGSLINAQTVQDKVLMSLTNEHRHKKNIVSQPHQKTYLSCRWCRWEPNAGIKKRHRNSMQFRRDTKHNNNSAFWVWKTLVKNNPMLTTMSVPSEKTPEKDYASVSAFTNAFTAIAAWTNLNDESCVLCVLVLLFSCLWRVFEGLGQVLSKKDFSATKGLFAFIYCRPDFTMSKHVANVFLLGYCLHLFKMDKVPATAKVQTAFHIEPQTWTPHHFLNLWFC